ncbi:DUF975 family protein [Oscillospiraceae bacterium 38-13]
MYEHIDRVQRKCEAAELLRDAQVSPKGMTALYMLLVLALNLVSSLSTGGFLQIFISIFTELLATVLGAGFVLYCMAVRRRERAEYLTLFDGFSFVGKIILLNLITSFFILLWSMLFFIPGIIAAYRYHFAMFNLYENPGIGVMEALDMSKRQTYGYKLQLFTLDLSYLGWALLAALPSLVLVSLVNRDVTMALLYGTPVPETYFGLPILALDLLFGLWQMVVCLFYLPHNTCVRLAYFETAKRTSGIGEGTEPQQSHWDGWNAPDGLS